MPVHWTYDDFGPEDDLFQGDILEPTDKLRKILHTVHPHFLDPKYTSFLLITQSCDLAVRKGKYSTQYLSIAVIRPLEVMLHDFVSVVCRTVGNGVYTKETKGAARQLLERLFNQNEQSLGLFYLHPDRFSGIDIPSVSLLRVSVTLRVDHYPVLKEARRGRLSSEFRSKLGWLVGNLYSRIGTQDWNEDPQRIEMLSGLIKQFLDSAQESYEPIWVPESWVTAAKEAGVKLDELDRDKILATLEACKPPSAKDQAVEHTLRVLREVMPRIDDESLQKFRNRLSNDSLFAKALRIAKSETRPQEMGDVSQ